MGHNPSMFSFNQYWYWIKELLGTDMMLFTVASALGYVLLSQYMQECIWIACSENKHWYPKLPDWTVKSYSFKCKDLLFRQAVGTGLFKQSHMSCEHAMQSFHQHMLQHHSKEWIFGIHPKDLVMQQLKAEPPPAKTLTHPTSQHTWLGTGKLSMQ